MSEQFLDRLNQANRDAVERVVADSAADVRESISIPVVRDLLGNVIQRSPPHRPPWLEFGLLHEGVSHRVSLSGDMVSGTVSSERVGDNPNVPIELEFGHGLVAPRPYMWPGLVRMRDNALQKISERIRGATR